MEKDWIKLCREVKNGRTISTAFDHSVGEMRELSDELKLVLTGAPAGTDGVVGEAVDVMLCMLDIIAQHDPDINMNDVEAVMHNKYSKWIRKYTNVEQKLQEE